MTESPDPYRSASRVTMTVSDLNREARSLLERGLARLWVEGEISNLARPASGHVYFTLKDTSAQIRCAWFRQRQRRGQAARIDSGDQVQAYGRVSLYEPRGDYQLIVEEIEPAGEGELRRRFELLKKKLEAEGLFDAALKRDLPALPRRIGIITSPSGAAVRDVLTVLRRRFPAIPVLIYPAAVQGEQAVPELLNALAIANRRADCDVLIVGRGGGSLEDLWAFNDEALARAIRGSDIPVISAVGHEVDFSIADLVADVRAPTPSGAAEIAVPDREEWQRAVAITRQRLVNQMARKLEDKSQALDWLARQLAAASPAATLSRQRQKLDALSGTLAAGMRHDLLSRRRRLDRLASGLMRRTPERALLAMQHRLERLDEHLRAAVARRLESCASRLGLAGRALNSVSPLATLDRGYAIVTDRGGKIVTEAAKVEPGDRIAARVASGRIEATVEKTLPAGDDHEDAAAG